MLTARSCLLLTLLLLLMGSSASLLGRAQGRAPGTIQPPPVIRVAGVVLAAADRRPIPGAGVFVVGTGLGTAADVTGAFQLTIARTDTLVIRAVGFRQRQFTVKPSSPARIGIEVLLYIDSVRLGEVTITADRPDRPEINRALRAIRRPSTALPIPTKSVGKPIFERPPPGPPPPADLQSPVSFLYEQFSRAGRNRRKLAEWEAERAVEQADKARQPAEPEYYNPNYQQRP